MILTIFRSRLMPDVLEDYEPWARRMDELAAAMPGYVSHKGFAADDGERVTVVAFETAEAQRAWLVHPEHVQAQRNGRQRFYSEYHIQVCELLREASFKRDQQG